MRTVFALLMLTAFVAVFGVGGRQTAVGASATATPSTTRVQGAIECGDVDA